MFREHSIQTRETIHSSQGRRQHCPGLICWATEQFSKHLRMKSWKAPFIFDYNSMKLEIAYKEDTGKKHKDVDTKHSKQPMSHKEIKKEIKSPAQMKTETQGFEICGCNTSSSKTEGSRQSKPTSRNKKNPQ